MVDEETGRVEMVPCDHIAVHSLLVNQTKLTTNACCQGRCGGVPNSAEISWEKVDSVRRYKKTGKVNFFLSKLKLLRIQHDSRITNKCEKIFCPSPVFYQIFVIVLGVTNYTLIFMGGLLSIKSAIVTIV